MHKIIAPAALIVIAAASDNIRIKIEARKAAKLYLAAQQAYEETIAAKDAQIDYVCHVLNENDIVPDEFDLIALNYHNE